MTQGLEILEGMSWVANKIALPLEATPFSTFFFFARRTKYTADGIIPLFAPSAMQADGYITYTTYSLIYIDILHVFTLCLLSLAASV